MDGGAGGDSLLGGSGDDLYVVDNIADRIIENAGAGTDTVRASVTWTLGDNLENLTLSGSGAINGAGNAGNNILTGNPGANTLLGGAGDDLYLVAPGDTVSETNGGGTDVLGVSLRGVPGLAAAIQNGLDSLSDLSCVKINSGRDLRINFPINGAASRGSVTVTGMANGPIETLRLYDVAGVQVGQDIDLTSAWAATGTTVTRLQTTTPGTYGLLVAPA